MFERSDLCMFEHSGLSVDDLFSITEDSLEFASEAVRLNPCTKYIQWLDIVKQGN